jgi:hypothetical protein
MSPKEVLGAIGLWVGVFLPLWFLRNAADIIGGAILILGLIASLGVAIVFVFLLYKDYHLFFNRETIIGVFVISACSVTTFAAIGTNSVNSPMLSLGVLFSLPIAILFYEIKIIKRLRHEKKDEDQY